MIETYESSACFLCSCPKGSIRFLISNSHFELQARRAANAKDIQDKFSALGFEIDPGPPEALAQRNRRETAKWAKAIKDAKIEPQ